ncbi:hypothetical protein K402DRAFT_419304 [Aulographum hederae CBS 113979]|uniref:Uncharacterized protein n=1 Tax=Aulographum hederae CBS 113979 TaxID=1176131 RepID=A0A6G1H622_9PEZI|nr:hypothetical protein K402DRAFT_419304 [Aulographum hederae CBS 113979]
MSKELKKLGSAEKKRLIEWARANEDDFHKRNLTLGFTKDWRGTLFHNNTFRLDQQGRFDVNGTTWLNLQVQMSNATLVTVYVHWDGYAKQHFTASAVLWAVKWSVTKEWEHHSVYMGQKKVGIEKNKKDGGKRNSYLNVLYKPIQPRDLAAEDVCTGTDLADFVKPGIGLTVGPRALLCINTS